MFNLRTKAEKVYMNAVCKYIWVGRHCRGIKVQSGNWRKVSDHENCEVLERPFSGNKVELAQFMDEIIRHSYL